MITKLSVASVSLIPQRNLVLSTVFPGHLILLVSIVTPQKYKEVKILKFYRRLRLPYTFRGVSRPNDVARPI